MWRKERCLKHSDYLAELTSSYESKKDEEIAPKRKGVKWEKYFRKNLERGRSIEAAVVNRCTERERFLVFCAARHPRLGAFSPARVLPKDCMRVIWKAMCHTDVKLLSLFLFCFDCSFLLQASRCCGNCTL